MKLTAEQTAIITAARETDDNILISARAGAAKTTTLVEIAKVVKKPSLFLAFNKAIATELSERLPEWCTASTLHSFGFSAWKSFKGRSRVNKNKRVDILKAHINKAGKYKESFQSDFSDLLNAVNHLAGVGWSDQGYPICGREDIQFKRNWDGPAEELIFAVARDAIAEGLKGNLDFSDMVLLPVIFRAPFPSYPLVYVDEAQDLSALNHEMLRLAVKKRLIAVGDPCQAIYGFRGADEYSMSAMQQLFSMKEYQLTTCFRCAKAVIEEAKFRTPDMHATEWAKPGAVVSLDTWTAADIEDGAAVICRYNAPLMRMAIRLLRAGRRPQLRGVDMGERLLKDMKSLAKDTNIPQEAALKSLEIWYNNNKRKYNDAEIIREKANCMRAFIEDQPTLAAAISHARRALDAIGPIHLMTGHKSKGLEYPTVYHLDADTIRDTGQDPNVRYVITTRAQERLVYIRSDDFLDETAKEGLASQAEC